MTPRRLSGLRRVLLAGAGLLLAAACASKTYTFYDDGPHCHNDALDESLGESDVDCGGECRACGPGLGCNSTLDCQRGECLGGRCAAASCDNEFRDQGETGIDCGGSCEPCPAGQPCLIADDCITGVCNPDTSICSPPKCDDEVLNGEESAIDCGGTVCDGCLTGERCVSNTDCQSGACDLEEEDPVCVVDCPQGSGDCIIDDGVECETNVLKSVENCGRCGEGCEFDHASALCVGGACQVDECEDGWDHCSTDAEDGCETHVSEDEENCGSCGHECSGDNGEPRCVAGKCEIDCDEGFRDCDDSPGCEARTTTDTANCGGCRKVCPEDPGESAYCADGKCGASVCPADFGNCDGPGGEDCAQDLRTDPENCGRCGRLCVVQHGTPACVDGECVVEECDEGWDNCNFDDDDSGYANGCETNTLVSENNCGACGETCDASHGAARCSEGSCSIESCDDGWDNCDRDDAGGFENGCETNIASAANCGVCGNDCGARFPNATTSCVDSECVQGDCAPGFKDCVAGTGSPGCESELATSEAHCGDCGNSCELSGALANTCEGGSCRVTCDAEHLNCDDDDGNGCETSQGLSRCGGCDINCASGAAVHSTSTACVAAGATSVCEPVCQQGWGACTNPEDGCLTQLNASPNCGSCGSTCTGSDTCVASGGIYRCQSPLTIVNNVATGGVAASSLTLTHNLQSGQNRVVVVAVAGRSTSPGTGGTIAQARPDSVRYNGVNMNVMGEFAGPAINQDGQGHLFYYFLTDTGTPRLPASGGQVVIDGSTAPSPVALGAIAAQFNGANQTTPLVQGGTSSMRGPLSTSASVTVGTTGSVIFSLAVAQYAGTITGATGALISPAPPTPPGQPLMNLLVGGGSGNLWRLGAAASAPLATGMYNVGWSWSYCDSAVHYAVVIQPAQKP